MLYKIDTKGDAYALCSCIYNSLNKKKRKHKKKQKTKNKQTNKTKKKTKKTFGL